MLRPDFGDICIFGVHEYRCVQTGDYQVPMLDEWQQSQNWSLASWRILFANQHVT